MIKLSAADVDQMLLKSASTIRSQQKKIHELEADLAASDRKQHAEKIAASLVERGLMEEDSAVEYAEKLASGDRDLAMVEELVGHSTTSIPLGEPLEKSASAGGDSDDDVLTRFLLNSDLSS